jgi:hypothetical protein
MVITYKNAEKIEYPIFILGSGNWDLVDGLLFLNEKVLDDRNMEGETLGIRRIQTPHKDVYILKRMVSSYNGILKQTQKYFIDNLGRPFIYEKTKFAQLKYIKIRKVEQKEVASLVWLKGHNAPFTVPRPPEVGYTWAGVLHLHGLPWVLYEYSETKLKDTRKKV